MEQPELPLEERLNRPTITAHVDGGLLAGSGVVVTSVSASIHLDIAGLSFDLRLEDVDDQQSANVKVQESTERGAIIVLQNFNNQLGSALRPIKVATISGKPTYLAVVVYAVGDKTRLVHYSVLWGGDHDR